MPAPKPPATPPAPPIEMAKKVVAPKKRSYKSAGVSSLTIPMNRPGTGVSIPGA
jgi:hypothetical protein